MALEKGWIKTKLGLKVFWESLKRLRIGPDWAFKACIGAFALFPWKSVRLPYLETCSQAGLKTYEEPGRLWKNYVLQPFPETHRFGNFVVVPSRGRPTRCYFLNKKRTVGSEGTQAGFEIVFNCCQRSLRDFGGFGGISFLDCLYPQKNNNILALFFQT
jgi:hypothetical protein